MFCNKCGTNLAQDAQFCAKCGTKADEQNATDNATTNKSQANKVVEKMAEFSAEKWKELSPKAKQAASVAGEKASAVSKDIISELKQSGAVLRQAIDENKGGGTETKTQIIGKTAASFLGKLTGKQKAILAGAAVLSVVVIVGLFGGDSDFNKVHEVACKMRDMERGKLSPNETEELAFEIASGAGGARDRLQAKYKGREDELARKLFAKGC